MPCRGRAVERTLGAALLAVSISGALGCDASPPPRASSAARPPSGFDGDRAFADLADLVALGPRPAGSAAAAAARTLIAERLRQVGWRVERRPFQVRGPGGRAVPMVNLVARLEGAVAAEPGRGKAAPPRLLLLTHYDTKRIPGIRFVGANDGASGVALLLELARQLSRRPPPFEVWMLFCDGEEAFGADITASDGLYGSRELARSLAEQGELDRVQALLLIDMVGDRDLNLATDRGSSRVLREQLLAAARALGLEGVIDPRETVALVDDHTPFVERGVSPVLALIDFQFGSRSTPGPYWHTARDDLDSVSAESLNSVGALVVEWIERLGR
ncbi:MAG: M28 family peptidase [Myxococcota bacterium]